MSLKTDDIDLNDVRLSIHQGGNGDYYINLFQINRDMFNEKGELVKWNDTMTLRVSMSGGDAHHDIKMAVFKLYEALNKHDKNIHPLYEIES